MLEYIEFLVPYLIVLFSALWDVPYHKLEVGKFYSAGQYDKVAWYRLLQHGGVYMFIIIMGMLVGWKYALIGIFLNWSGVQDLIWHWLLNIPNKDKQYFKNWTPLGMLNKYITKIWKDDNGYFIPTKYHFSQIIIMLLLSFMFLIIL